MKFFYFGTSERPPKQERNGPANPPSTAKPEVVTDRKAPEIDPEVTNASIRIAEERRTLLSALQDNEKGPAIAYLDAAFSKSPTEIRRALNKAKNNEGKISIAEQFPDTARDSLVEEMSQGNPDMKGYLQKLSPVSLVKLAKFVARCSHIVDGMTDVQLAQVESKVKKINS